MDQETTSVCRYCMVGGCRDRTDGHRSLASLQNEAARRGFSARNDLTQRMSKPLAGKLKALTMNRYCP